ncbi:hypothetical protein J6590_059121 [Homalodisca vitripennis]|nr:hypothetical protein J6590_059121 [Homalodisca vitripennis]
MTRYTGGILEVDWRYTGGVLEVYWRCARGILEMYWRYTGDVLEVYWRCSGGMLEVYWRYTVGVLEVYAVRADCGTSSGDEPSERACAPSGGTKLNFQILGDASPMSPTAATPVSSNNNASF